ncbi:LYS5 [[Candida] subhashii]|uniref:LYS5 n=1 Tax=[Candida] subhashii TaxID=561895 RepID=A0A8J5QH77_9ASCO|nr:LYS5 [[Candida] subhashii]KAG7662068.1 LYS5 [[Candida] subhashii]
MTSSNLFDGLELITQAPKSGKSNVILFTTRITSKLTEFLQDDFNFELSLRLLNNLKEQLRIQSIKDESLRFKQLIASLFTRAVFNSLLEKDLFENIKFTYNDYGKPQLLNQNFQFNSSSSNDIISIIIEFSDTANPIGIDLSHARQPAISKENCIEEFRSIFHPVELSYFDTIEDVERRYFEFNHFWTLKEAFTKLIGSGLNVELADFYFNVKQEFSEKQDQHCNESIPRGMVSEYSLDWFRDIQLNIDNLLDKRNKFIENLSNKSVFNCHCSILENRQEEELPVIITFINQNEIELIRSFELNFENILNKYI